jgi:RNA polymerase sigma-70 factor, ECF subfamily
VERDDDPVLVERCRKGDRAALAALVARYQGPIYNAAYRVLGNPEDANDIAQDVFLKIVERLDGYDSKFKFFSWIYRIAINESLNVLRGRRRDDPLDEDRELPAPESANPEWKASQAELSRRVQGALMGMKADDRVVVTLRHFSGCSYAEIAQILDVDEKTVKSRLFEARRRLRLLLKDLHDA